MIEVRHIGLSVPIYERRSRSFKTGLDWIASLYRPSVRQEQKTLLEDITFVLEAGTRLAVLGSNGAGKTTLLKVLSGIIRPSTGSIEVRGGTSALFNMKIGMLHNATGLENIYLKGLQMGLTKREIEEKISSIIEFSELGKAIEDPFYTYSAGMQLKLASSVFLTAEAPILIVDEWIGSGDHAFKKKVRSELLKKIESSKVLVIASHNFEFVLNTCNKAIIVDKGKLKYFGAVEEAIEIYKNQSHQVLS